MLNSKQKKLVQPDFKVYTSIGKTEEYDLECKRPKMLVFEFQLPLLIHSRGIHLEVNEEMLYLLVKGIYEVCLLLPIKVGKFAATFVKKRRTLKVSMEAAQ